MDEDAAHAKFRQARWERTGGEPVCPNCGCLDAYPIKGRKVMTADRHGKPLPARLGDDGKILAHAVRRWKCRGCRKEFSVTVDTIFQERKLGFKEILIAIYLFADPAKGVAALKLCHDLGVQYKTAFVLEHKIREAMLLEQRNRKLNGLVQIDGMYSGGHVKFPNVHGDRKDLRKTENRTGKRLCVVGARECGPNGRSRVCVVAHERDAVAFVCDTTDRMAIVHADEASSWDSLHAHFQMGRVNHSKQFWDDGVCTNQMESLFSRLRRMETGTHHRIAGSYLLAYAAECSWREDHRRVSNGEKTALALSNAMAAGVSPVWKGYWQRRRGDDLRVDIWAHARDDSLASMVQ